MIIGLTGKNGSGKGEVAKYLENRGFHYYSLSDVLREEAAKQGSPVTRDVLVELGNRLRNNHGTNLRQIFTQAEMRSGKAFSVVELAERHHGYTGFLPPQAQGLMESTRLSY